jgi:phage terminase large subunit-like protein
MTLFTPRNIERWRADPVAFIEDVLIDPETDAPFVLSDAQRRFVRLAFKLAPDGRLLYPEQVFSAPKKSGKTGLAAMLMIYVILVLAGKFAEGYCVANDLEQAQGRVFQAIRRIIAASPALAETATVTNSKIEFDETGATIAAIASGFADAAGANPTITVFDELWGVRSEAGYRLWDEMVPPPTRKIACRLTVTYAGFTGESVLLEALYKRGLTGEQIEPDLYELPGMLMFWTNSFTAPWQTPEWREQMRGQLRPNGYLRLIENRWVTSESTFVEMTWFDACVDVSARPLLADRGLSVWIGVDASVKRDSTALVACTFDHALNKIRLVCHRVFQPTQTDHLDFEATIEATLIEWAGRFDVREVRFDPYQMQAVAQRLAGRGIPMVEFPQSMPNLTDASTNLYEAIKGQNLIVYADDAIRLAVQRAVAVETARGWRIAKEKQSHKIDVVVAMGMAALGAVGQGINDGAEYWRTMSNLPAGETENRYDKLINRNKQLAAPDPGRAALDAHFKQLDLRYVPPSEPDAPPSPPAPERELLAGEAFRFVPKAFKLRLRHGENERQFSAGWQIFAADIADNWWVKLHSLDHYVEPETIAPLAKVISWDAPQARPPTGSEFLHDLMMKRLLNL